ncbi:MAG: hypothetical protein IJX56_05260 [Alistipes sp.]|nr:hypothetical protein [Alistipes sp.]
MKRLLLIVFVGLLFAPACVSRQSADRMQLQIDSLQQQVKAKEAMIDEVFSSISTITENLAEIKHREGIITLQNDEVVDTTALGRLQSDVEMIDQLMAENRERLAELENTTKQLRRANARIKGLEKLVKELNSQIEERDVELSHLKDRLHSMGTKINSLLEEVAAKDQQVQSLSEEKSQLKGEVAEKTTALHTAYYILAPQKQLINDQVIRKKGFIGRTLVVTETPNLGLFTQADTRLLRILPIGQKDATLITSHPEGSYWLVESENDSRIIESLVITDPDQFWSLSKILVISHK